MNELTALLTEHGAWMIFPLALVEGPLVVLASTALAQLGTLKIGWVWVIAVLADIAGDAGLYAIGRYLPDVLPARMRPQIARERASTLFRKSGPGLLLFAKFTHFVGLPTLVSAGFGRMPFPVFLLWNLAGTLVKVSVIVLVGWYFWQAVLAGDVETAMTILVGFALLCAAAFLAMRLGRWT